MPEHHHGVNAGSPATCQPVANQCAPDAAALLVGQHRKGRQRGAGDFASGVVNRQPRKKYVADNARGDFGDEG